jgi:hypothetical protein
MATRRNVPQKKGDADIVGLIELVENNERIVGWAFDRKSPSKRLDLRLREGEVVLSQTIAEIHRADLAEAGCGDGGCGFVLYIPSTRFDGKVHHLSVFAGSNASQTQVGESFKLRLPGETPSEPAEDIADADIFGFVDTIDPSWRILGWAFDRNSPSRRLVVRLLEDGVVLSEAIAERYRQDVADAQYGDGSSGFMLDLPSTMFDGRVHHLSVFAGSYGSQKLIGKPFELALPARLKRRKESRQRASELLNVIGQLPRSALQEESAGSTLDDILRRLTSRFGTAVALDLLYVYLLGRHIDPNGLEEGLRLLEENEQSYKLLVQQVLRSPEYVSTNKWGYAAGLASPTVLSAWLESGTMLRQQ